MSISAALQELSADDIRRGSTKTSRSRKVKLPAWAAADLRAWRLQQAEELLRLGVRQTGETPVCTDPAGRPMTPNRITDQFQNLANLISIRITFHDLRHTSASLALAAGASIKEVANRLGRSRTSMTLDIYAHAVEGIAEDAADRLDRIIGAARDEL